MNPFKIALAEEAAQQIGALIMTEECPSCRHPLILKMDQDIAFCWFCAVDKASAQRGKTVLTKIKLGMAA
jgi:hypothetical protein